MRRGASAAAAAQHLALGGEIANQLGQRHPSRRQRRDQHRLLRLRQRRRQAGHLAGGIERDDCPAVTQRRDRRARLAALAWAVPMPVAAPGAPGSTRAVGRSAGGGVTWRTALRGISIQMMIAAAGSASARRRPAPCTQRVSARAARVVICPAGGEQGRRGGPSAGCLALNARRSATSSRHDAQSARCISITSRATSS